MPILKVNDIVYVAGDYFDYGQEERWSEMMGLNWKTHSILGIIKSFHKQEVNVLWLVDFRESKVHIQDVTKVPKDLHPICGSIRNHSLNSIKTMPKLCLNKDNKMTKREQRLSGENINIYYDYEPKPKRSHIRDDDDDDVDDLVLYNEYF